MIKFFIARHLLNFGKTLLELDFLKDVIKEHHYYSAGPVVCVRES